MARTAPLVGLAGRTAGEAVVASLRKRVRGADTAEFHARAAERYAERLGRSKGVLMKAGQIMSFVGFTVEGENQSIYQRALARLQDDAPPMPPEMAAAMVEAELGAPPQEVFAEFEPEPIAAASIGQVHRATTRDGRRVAVKVQYPGVEEAIRADLANTELIATFFQMGRGLLPGMTRMDVRAVAKEVSERIGEEIDYRAEARNQREFAGHYRGHPFIRIPEIVPELSGRRVLTMDLVDGMRHREALGAGQELKDRWGEAVFRFYIGGIRRLGLFHADPHPGNFLFHDDGTVTFLDFGCVKRFQPEQVRFMTAVAEATVTGDAETLLRLHYDEGVLDRDDPPPADQVLGWWTSTLYAWTRPQPFTYTPETDAVATRGEFGLTGPYGEFIRKWRMDPAMTTLTRIQLGMSAVLSQFRATADWERIRQEWDWDGPPATPMGELDKEFWGGVRVR
ncbi:MULTISPECIES: ABC1 kinase family protein [Thermomonosporaceae]|uniref:ABC1 kinase family protein n=1 Tax=Thermomonosporaceae TaxID=2012 RepID=UPI00255AF56A|nr:MULTISPECIES: AarF/ABC1/UbiB kinase family protein [Thermomonosporaceae]MDL4776750.1 AarF/ABC1/UbiB kinase family protein [Actinomadura xylanilytica]